MPYIPQDKRPKLDTLIDQLAEEIKNQSKENTDFAGMLNYCCTTLLLKIAPAKRYWVIAMITGVMHNVLDEFYRRYASKYEDDMIKNNGDIFEYEKIRN